MNRMLSLSGGFLTCLSAASTFPTSVLAQQYRSTSQYLDAEIVNLRRDARGRVSATVVFTSKPTSGVSFRLHGTNNRCEDGGTLVDGLGNDYVSDNCINTHTTRPRSDWNGIPFDITRPGIQLDGPASAPFVYRFETPLPADASGNSGVDISIPIMIEYSSTNFFRSEFMNVTFSFYGMNIPYRAPTP
jgi:hypothetical protein